MEGTQLVRSESKREDLFSINKLFQRYLLASILSSLFGEHALRLLWTSNQKARRYLIENFALLSRHYLAKPIKRKIIENELGKGGTVYSLSQSRNRVLELEKMLEGLTGRN